jgi:hypothetical protein
VNPKYIYDIVERENAAFRSMYIALVLLSAVAYESIRADPVSIQRVFSAMGRVRSTASPSNIVGQ